MEGSQVIISPQNIIFQDLSLKIDFVSANSADPGELPHIGISSGPSLSARVPI